MRQAVDARYLRPQNQYSRYHGMLVKYFLGLGNDDPRYNLTLPLFLHPLCSSRSPHPVPNPHHL